MLIEILRVRYCFRKIASISETFDDSKAETLQFLFNFFPTKTFPYLKKNFTIYFGAIFSRHLFPKEKNPTIT